MLPKKGGRVFALSFFHSLKNSSVRKVEKYVRIG
nr:MAG TPA: hypothetical protein [Caudoviricetes sp.]DAQ91226.1 MAG TPA: hypothetical protein [Caudoviricetes sp.]